MQQCDRVIRELILVIPVYVNIINCLNILIENRCESEGKITATSPPRVRWKTPLLTSGRWSGNKKFESLSWQQRSRFGFVFIFLNLFYSNILQEVQLAKLMQIESCIEGNKLHK